MVSFMKKNLAFPKEKRVSQEVQLRFLTRLARLLSNGYPLIEALEIMKWDKQMLLAATKIISSLKSGKTIDEAFEIVNFHHSITAHLYFIRMNGDIIGSLEKCIDMFEHRIKYLKKFKQITQYPLILLSVFFILLFFIKQYILPSFMEIFASSAEASSTVALSIMIIELISRLVMVCGVGLTVLILLWQFFKQKFSIDKKIKLYSSIPIYRSFLRMQTSFQFAMHLSAQLKTGMPMKEILTNMSIQKKLPIISYYSTLMTADLQSGLALAHLLSQLTLLEKQISSIFQRNTDKGMLEKDLAIYAELVIEELHRKIMKVLTLIQPVFFVFLASFIILIYMTIMWPMFQLIKTI